MRNWNQGKCGMIKKDRGLYRTYEELKLFQIPVFDSVPIRRLYRTYEELKRVFLTCSWYQNTPVCIVPMRNWNKRSKPSLRSPLQSLYRTYEELKHLCPPPYRRLSAHCLYRTYEELKPVWKKKFCKRFGSLYRTYEELKLSSLLEKGVIYEFVCIVPMRNWNISAAAFLVSFFRVCIVPMRNWNRCGSAACKWHMGRLYRTYEELKP